MTLGSIWGIAQTIDTIAGLIGLLKNAYKRIIRNPEEKSPVRQKATPIRYEKPSLNPQSSIPGSMENGRMVFRWRGKEYDLEKSTLVCGHHGGRIAGEAIYRTNENSVFFMVYSCPFRIHGNTHFVGEYSKEEVREWLDTHGAPGEAYERAGIELQVA